MLYSRFVALVDKLPLPSRRAQVLTALAVVLAQAGIAVTGSIVRVTASGLGCPTWPQCFPGSFTPVEHPEVQGLHQFIEFGNRLLTFVVVLTSALIVLAVIRARRRREVQIYAWLMPASTVVQAVVGGITVLTGLLWWTVAIHLLLSMAMVWLSVLLLEKVRQPDHGVQVDDASPLARSLVACAAVAMTGILIVGTMVTGAGPHAGDKSIENAVPRLEINIMHLIYLHGALVVTYLLLLTAIGILLWRNHAPRRLVTRLLVAILVVAGQAAVGITQVRLDVPSALVVVHVLGAGMAVAAAASLWVATRPRLPRAEAETAAAVVSTTP